MFNTTTTIEQDPTLGLLHRLERRMGRVFGQPFGLIDWVLPDAAAATWLPFVDVYEGAGFVRLVAEVPGVRPENVHVTVEGDLLTIKGNKDLVAEERIDRVHHCERAFGTFERTFTLPSTVQPEKIKATYDQGVLTITLPKLEAAKPEFIKVAITPAEPVEVAPARK